MTAFPEIGGTMGSLKRTGKNGGNQTQWAQWGSQELPYLGLEQEKQS